MSRTLFGGVAMPLSAQEKAAIITVAGNWALKSVEEASPAELAEAVSKTGSLEGIYIPFFLIHYDNLVNALSGK